MKERHGDGGGKAVGKASRRQLVVGTVNITGAGSFDRLSCLREADIWAVQETKLETVEEIAGFQSKLQRLGYRVCVAPSLRGPRQGRSSGVALLWKPWIKVNVKPEVLVEGRALAMGMEHPKLGQWYCYAVYSYQAGDRRVPELYDTIRQHTLGHGKPFVVAGDHNHQPADFSRVLDLVGNWPEARLPPIRVEMWRQLLTTTS